MKKLDLPCASDVTVNYYIGDLEYTSKALTNLVLRGYMPEVGDVLFFEGAISENGKEDLDEFIQVAEVQMSFSRIGLLTTLTLIAEP